MERIMTGTVTQANFVGIVSMVAAENDGPRKLSLGPDPTQDLPSRGGGSPRQLGHTSASTSSGRTRHELPAQSAAGSGTGTAAKVSVLVIDDCALHREVLAAMITMNGVADVCSAWDVSSLVGVLEDVEPEVILLNVATCGRRLILRAATSLSPHAPVIAIGTSEDDEEGIIACAEAGVAGYHLRSDSFSDLVAMIAEVVVGRTSCPPQISAMLLNRLSALASQRQPSLQDSVLTTREVQILEMLELGKSNQDIAGELAITVHTVKNHVHNLLKKLGVSTRAEAAALSHTIQVDRGTSRES